MLIPASLLGSLSKIMVLNVEYSEVALDFLAAASTLNGAIELS